MINKNLLTVRNVAFVVLFLGMIMIADRFAIFQMYTADSETGELTPSGKDFTAIQFFAPIAGGLLQSTVGITVVFVSQFISLLINGTALNLTNITRLLTLVFGAYYFGKARESWWISLVPLITIAVFLATTDTSAWYYVLIWVVPFVCALPQLNNIVFARALGATFTAHALGNLWFMVFFGFQPAVFWIALFPITIAERIAMAAGITVSYFAMNALLSKYFSDIPVLNVEKKYAIF